MGRELKRVALDFDWPLNEPWSGYLNHFWSKSVKCSSCEGDGGSPETRRLKNLWYGYVPFKPEDRGSVPFLPTDEPVWAFANGNVERSPSFYGIGYAATLKEARRLAELWNGCWSHHLNGDDVAALIDAGRLQDITHTWTRGEGWKVKEPAYQPSAREVNVWSLSGMGHDSINYWVVADAECKRNGWPTTCAHCEGEGNTWLMPEDRANYESWKATEPPEGEGYQIWETVSEGSPISPVFRTPDALARHMATTRWGADEGSSVEEWLKFINGPGWAPSLICCNGRVQDGVSAVVSMTA